MDRLKKILAISLPIMAGMMSQNVLNLVDIAMVGKLGPEHIAAVGLGGLCSFLMGAYVIGFAAAVQAMSARRFGEGSPETTALPLNGGLIMSVLVGIPVTIILFILTPKLYPFINHDAAVVGLGIPYLKARLIATVAMGINFSFSGFWNGTNRSHRYMIVLIATNVLNIFFNWVFIFGHLGAPAYGSFGAGIASTVAIMCGTGMYFVMGLIMARDNGFLKKIPDKEMFRTLIRLAFPTAIQHTFFAGGILVVLWIIGLIGTMELAASQIITMLMLVGILPGVGMGLSATSLVSQALGKDDPDDAERWGWEITGMTVTILLLIGIPMVLFPLGMLKLFTTAPEVHAVGKVPLQMTGAILGIEAIMIVCSKALIGAGDNTRVMFTAIALQWGIYLPLAYLAGPIMGMGLTGVWMAQLIYKIIGGVVYALMWRNRKWAGIKI